MVCIFQTEQNVLDGSCSVKFNSNSNFYGILNSVKTFSIGYSKENKEWEIGILDCSEFVESLNGFHGDTIHIDLDIFKNLLKAEKQNRFLLSLRDTLRGVDCKIKLNKPYSLLPFQEVGVEFMSIVKNGLIADKVGLGKTLQGFSSAMRLRDDGVIKKSIIICKPTLKKKWAVDIKNFTEEKTITQEGTPTVRKNIFKKWIESDVFFLIIGYETLRNDFEKFMVQDLSVDFGIVMDEVQKIKNVRAQVSKVIKLLSKLKNCKSRIGLSATYVETNMADLFGVMAIIDPNVFGLNWMKFLDKFVKTDYFGNPVGSKNVNIASERMKLVSVRRNKFQVQDQLAASLPEITENTLWVDLTKVEKLCYNDIVDKVTEKIKDLEQASKVLSSNSLTLSILERQACLSTEIVGYETSVSSKIKVLLELLPEIIEDGNKCVIFTYFTSFVDIIERELKKNGIKSIAMHGKRKEGHSKNRQNNVDLFSESKDINVIVTSDILAEGVDIPAASYVINMDILWNPAKMTQRNGRIDRLSQKSRHLYVYNILTNGTVEEEMYTRVYRRYQMGLDIMDDGVEENRIQKLSNRDFKNILTKKV